MFERRIGHAPINFTNLDLIFFHGVVHALVDASSVGPMEFFFFSRDMTDPTLEKNKIDQNYSKKTKKTIGPTLNPFERKVQSNTGLKIQCKILKIERRIAEMPFFSKLLDLYMESS